MVDPNRKINHLTPEDVEFLRECEEQFCHRYDLEHDVEFREHCERATENNMPPLVFPWQGRRPPFHGHRGGGGGGDRGYGQANRPFRHARGGHFRGGGVGNFHRGGGGGRYHHGGGGGDGGGGYQQHRRKCQHDDQQRYQNQNPQRHGDGGGGSTNRDDNDNRRPY